MAKQASLEHKLFSPQIGQISVGIDSEREFVKGKGFIQRMLIEHLVCVRGYCCC